MKIGVIGYARHALRHINIISQYADVVVYHPHKEGVCNDFEQILSCDGVVISSPTKTHIHYVNMLKGYKGTVYLEKPGFEELDEVDVLYNTSLNLMIGYHFPYCDSIRRIKGKEIISISINDCKMISDLEWFANDWRAEPNKIVATVLCHAISVYRFLCGDNEIDIRSFGYSASATTTSMPLLNAFCSWSAPYDKYIRIITKEEVIHLDEAFRIDNSVIHFLRSTNEGLTFSKDQLTKDINIGRMCKMVDTSWN